MMNGVGGSSANVGAQYDIAVAKKALGAQQEEGRQALQLLESAAQPLATEGSLGKNLNVMA